MLFSQAVTDKTSGYCDLEYVNEVKSHSLLASSSKHRARLSHHQIFCNLAGIESATVNLVTWIVDQVKALLNGKMWNSVHTRFNSTDWGCYCSSIWALFNFYSRAGCACVQVPQLLFYTVIHFSFLGHALHFIISIVLHTLFVTSMAAPASKSHSTTCAWPCIEATWSAEKPLCNNRRYRDLISFKFSTPMA